MKKRTFSYCTEGCRYHGIVLLEEWSASVEAIRRNGEKLECKECGARVTFCGVSMDNLYW